jgi:hypothetical protein
MKTDLSKKKSNKEKGIQSNPKAKVSKQSN